MPGGGIDPRSVQYSASMKNFTPFPSGKPDKQALHLETLTKRRLCEFLTEQAFKGHVRHSLRLLLFRLSQAHPMWRLVRRWLRFLNLFLRDMPVYAGTLFSGSAIGGAGGILQTAGRAPPTFLDARQLHPASSNLSAPTAQKSIVFAFLLRPIVLKLRKIKMSLEQRTQNAQNEIEAKKPGFLKKAAVAAMVILSLGAYKANAADMGVAYKQTPQGQTKGQAAITVGNGVYDKSGKLIGVRAGNAVRDAEGNNYAIQDLVPQSHTYIKQQSPYQDIDEQIRRNPNEAKLYIQKANDMIKNRSSPEKIIEMLETVLKLKKDGTLKWTQNDLVEVYYTLGLEYYALGRYNKSIENFSQVKKTNPLHEKVKFAEYSISQIRNLQK